MLELRNVSVSFGNVRAVQNVSLSLSRSRPTALIGPNGSGKSTLLNAITGAVASTGHVLLDGNKLRFHQPENLARAGVMRTFQTPQTFQELSCRENVMLGTSLEGMNGLTASLIRRRKHNLLERERNRMAVDQLRWVGLLDVADASAGKLSYGQQRLLELARVAAARPAWLLMDEPAAGLNSSETDHLQGLLQDLVERGVGLFVIEHKLKFVGNLCDDLAVLEQGALIANGPMQETLREAVVMDAYLGRAAEGADRQ